MKGIKIIYIKEIKNFLVRKVMLKWYLMLFAINILIVFLGSIDSIPITQNRALLSLIMTMFIALLVPNNLSIDVIGGEKYHKTLETIISSPVKVRAILIGKILFIFTLSLILIVVSTISNNLLLKVFYSITFLDSGFNMKELALIYGMVFSSIIIIALIGSWMSLVYSNLKLNGYIVSGISIAIAYIIFFDFANKTYNILFKNTIGFIITSTILMLLFLTNISKKRVMEHI